MLKVSKLKFISKQTGRLSHSLFKIHTRHHKLRVKVSDHVSLHD